jgi:hypothetical protein
MRARRGGEALGGLAHHLAHAVLHEARVHVRLLDHLDLVGRFISS